MKFFHRKTIGDIVAMGKNTFLSMGGIPLDGRVNCVISNTMPPIEGVEQFRSFEEIIKKYKEFWIIGGAQLYNHALESGFVEYALITHLHHSYGADTFLRKFALEKFSSKVLFEGDGYSVIEYL
jgi:dihydrofolate reductase